MYQISKYGSRHWALYDPDGELVTVTVYKKGAAEVKRRLESLESRLLHEPPVPYSVQPTNQPTN